jgi:hypothetical protein
MEVPVRVSVRLVSVSTLEDLAERDIFWVLGGSIAASVTHIKLDIRGCAQKMSKIMIGKNSFT